MKQKLNDIAKIVHGKFFTVERKIRNKTSKHCAKLISESPKYMTIVDVNTGLTHKMSKNSVMHLNCGKYSV